MRYLFLFLFSIIGLHTLSGQSEANVEKGKVSYVTARHVYVKFASTDPISVGDTLFLKRGDQLIPALLVQNKSSVSCVCLPVQSERITVTTEVIHKSAPKETEVEVAEVHPEKPEPKPEESRKTQAAPQSEPDPAPIQEEAFKQNIRGRFSVSSYNNLSSSRNSHRMRYTFSLRADHIRDSKFSADSYVTFRHAFNEWDEVRNNLARALKIYSLSVKYDLDSSSSLSLGRRINPRISSMGAIDGLQFEKGKGNFLLGAIVGSRPDYKNYGFDPSLVQAGVYVGYISDKKKKNYQQNTLALVEQKNRGKTDRRFVYFQHSSNPLRNLSVFGSFEFDLYEHIHNKTKNTWRLTNLYTSVRYRFSRMLNVSLSYDNRKNVIYYESYKNFIDQLIDNETRQGLRLHFNVRPFKNVSWGMSTSWRFQEHDGNVSRNLNSYVNISRISSLKVTSTLTVNVLNTNFLKSKILGVRLFKDIIPGKLNGDIYYRWVTYSYKNLEFNTRQHITGVNFSFRLTRKLGFYLYYEGIFDNRNKTYNRINGKIVKRF